MAQMAQDGYARAIYPVHTPGDGDTAFSLATGTLAESARATAGQVGALAADVTATAILDAVRSATSLPGLPAATDLHPPPPDPPRPIRASHRPGPATPAQPPRPIRAIPPPRPPTAPAPTAATAQPHPRAPTPSPATDLHPPPPGPRDRSEHPSVPARQPPPGPRDRSEHPTAPTPHPPNPPPVNTTLLLLLAYSAGLIGLGLWLGRRVSNAGGFFVAGRSLGPGLLFATVLAANIGAGTTIGAAGLGYRDGLAGWWWVGSAGVGTLVLALWVGPRIWAVARAGGHLTLGDYLDDRYGPSVRAIIAVLLWLGTLALLAGQLIAMADIFTVVAGWPRGWGGGGGRGGRHRLLRRGRAHGGRVGQPGATGRHGRRLRDRSPLGDGRRGRLGSGRPPPPHPTAWTSCGAANPAGSTSRWWRPAS